MTNMREIEVAMERIESAEKALAKIAYDTIDPIAEKKIGSVIERDLRRARESLATARSRGA
jgi:hypothetical protein